MIKIGDFSRLGQVSVKALRHYDDIGLFQPAYVDEQSGYRYYKAAQLPRLHRLLALKDLGFSLEQIAVLINHDVPDTEIRKMLRLKLLETQQRLQEEQARLHRVEARLQKSEQETIMSAYEVVVKRVDPIRVASVKDVAPSMRELGPTFNRLFDEVAGHIHRHGGRIAGPALDLYHDTEYRETDVHVEAAMPVDGPVPDGDRVKVSVLPAVETMACTVHTGAFDGLSQAFGALMNWIETNGYRICGPNREVYIEYDRNGDPAKYVTEI